ncbi:G-type lectin S-receptor-like serine/threonine-protein kinase LECRK3 [Arachis duranensis]|uniref:Receptor-like serine/threonine-protein kinase n=1 Tax=Arachis duranensis TaxID=130453 RepID=A0A6P4C9H6_ARADU|nr:G-type lectin S-receptor-like serine/threonine-protein kinase LECRK3 [Arachis duranensis]
MASNRIHVLFLWLPFCVALAAEAAVEKSIWSGDLLSPPDSNTTNPSSWVSSSGHFAFGFYRHGNGHGYAIGIWLIAGTNETVVWTANRDDPPISSNSTLQLTVDGLLLKQGSDAQGQVYVASEPAGSASMLDSGNFVIYSQESSFFVVWQSFHHPTDTILGGQNLTILNQLVSSRSTSDRSTGHYYLAYQRDNNLVAYPVNSSSQPLDAYWASMDYFPYMIGVEQLSLDTKGNLCFIAPTQCLATNTHHQNKPQNTSSIYRATLDVDGNLRLYEHLFEDVEGSTITNSPSSSSLVHTLWQAFTDECQIKGFCGSNSFCSNIRGNARCQCYPGFVPYNTKTSYSNAMFLECKLNYTKDDCERSGGRNYLLYNTVSLEEMRWDDCPYWAKPMSMEACNKSCKEDCDCGAALYTNGQCNKYSLPVRYGRKVPNASDTGMALFKVPSGYVIGKNTTTSSPKNPNAIVNNQRGLILILASTLGSISFLCVVFVVSIFFIYRSQVHRFTKLSASSNLGFTEECSLRSFSFDELVKATSGFTEEVGRGSFGAVYRGTIGENSKRIAVKRIEKFVDEGEREFRAEITAISRTHHRNLVKLIGFCIEGSRKLLVYEYVSNGSLANLLFKTKKHLPWKERLKIALDVARGVQYLHEECEVRIVHCNLKPHNILMDELLTAKISDFGLARLSKPELSSIRPDKNEVRTGYLAPEWQKEALASVKADVFSYGIVLLEIVCRRRSIEVNVPSPEEVLLSSWAYHCFATEQLHKLVAYNEDEKQDMDWKTLERMVKVGLLCVQDDPSLRPSMRNVILMLEGWKDVPIPPSPSC